MRPISCDVKPQRLLAGLIRGRHGRDKTRRYFSPIAIRSTEGRKSLRATNGICFQFIYHFLLVNRRLTLVRYERRAFMLKTIIVRGKVSARSLCRRYFQIFSPLFVFAQGLFINFPGLLFEISKAPMLRQSLSLIRPCVSRFFRSYHHRPEISRQDAIRRTYLYHF